MQSSAGGTWSGNLYADGTGSGTFQSSDFSGGSWQVSYSGTAFELTEPTPTTAAPQPTATTAPPTAVPPTPTTATSLAPTLDANALLALGDLQSAIQRKLALIQSGGESDHPAVLSPWLYGQMVRVELEDEQPVVVDIYGHRVEVDENGLPKSDPSVIESPSAEIVNAHPDLDWSSMFDAMSDSAYNAFSNFTEPTFQFLEQTTEGIEPAEIANGFFGFLNQLSTPPDDELSPDESTVAKGEAALQETNKKLAEQQVELSDDEKMEVQGAVDEVEEEEEYTWREHYVEVLKDISAEDWDLMVSQGIDPVLLMRNKKTADETLVKFNQFFGNQSISDLADKFDLVPDEVNAMKAKLNALGGDPQKAEELAQATLALRVITELASDHTVSSDGYFDKVVWAFSFLAINKASQDALMDELQGKVELTPAQINLIMENRGSGIVEALTGQQDPEDDPLLSALISEIAKRAVQ
jgi:hypothetical protein